MMVPLITTSPGTTTGPLSWIGFVGVPIKYNPGVTALVTCPATSKLVPTESVPPAAAAFCS